MKRIKFSMGFATAVLATTVTVFSAFAPKAHKAAAGPDYYWFDVSGSVGSLTPATTPDIKAGDGALNTKTAVNKITGNDLSCDGSGVPCVGGYTASRVNLNPAGTRATSVKTISAGVFAQPITLVKHS